ncbi:MAG: PorT family protein [Candidatus Moduliflexus flocculans]|nr:PorT family protein [Candidatus Moduliflexus flocculans]
MLVLPSTAAAGVRFGIKGGANIANVNGNFADNIGDWKNTVGFCAGIFVELNLGRILTIQPEVLYTMKGADTLVEEGELTGTGKLRVRLHRDPGAAQATAPHRRCPSVRLRRAVVRLHAGNPSSTAFSATERRSKAWARPITAPSSAEAFSWAARSISTSGTRWGSRSSRSPTWERSI